MAKYGERLIQDLLQQFKGKERIEALLEVVGNQLDQVYEFYENLNLNRALATAQGVQLDRIGSILVLTRAEAGLLIQDNEDYVIDDDTYRYILAYKIMLNNGSATYYDIVRGIKQFYNLDILYSETPDEPASFMLEVGAADANIPLRNILPVKAAGVLCYYRFRLGGAKDAIEVSERLKEFSYDVPECGTVLCGTYWLNATIGNTSEYPINTSTPINGYGYVTDFAGTIPQISTRGRTDSFVAQITAHQERYTITSGESGDSPAGTLPIIATLGGINRVQTGVSSNIAGYVGETNVSGGSAAGTLPDVATLFNSTKAEQRVSVRSEAIPVQAHLCGDVYCGQ